MPTTFCRGLVLILGTCAALVAAGVSAQQADDAKACDSAQHRQFDFWLGEWQVTTPDGRVAGTNRIRRAFDGCVLHEQYDTGRGYRGASFNIYDAGRDTWHQTWVDNGGTLLRLEGGLRDGLMVLEGVTLDDDGNPVAHRIIWTPNDDGTVRQLWQVTDATGEQSVAFDGLYTPLVPD
jgi:hypothetical protein